jgi:peptidoglycan/xylan/chitin deacetylase (PgdA/CDA1 family)
LPLLDRITTRLVRHFPGPRLPIICQRPTVSFTFDDVPEATLANGAAILEAHQARGTFYVAGGLAGTGEYGCTMLSAAGYGELAARGHELACHTFLHKSVRTLSRRQLAADLERNANYLAGVSGGVAARNFAFPKTIASPHVRRELNRRFRSCRGGLPGINRGAVDRSFLKAVEIRPVTPIDELAAWIRAVVDDPGWLIFFTHDVSRTPSTYGCLPATLDRLLGDASAQGCAVLTVDTALDAVGITTENENVRCQ